MMRKRTIARECALQLLYQWDVAKTDPGDTQEQFWQGRDDVTAESRTYAVYLFDGTVKHVQSIDALLTKYTEHWELHRMAVVDRNILRLGTHELLYASDVPAKVTINEAVELAKRFGDVDSGKFINGILDKIHKSEPRVSEAIP
jgi:transcription antitermination factor NusB